MIDQSNSAGFAPLLEAVESNQVRPVKALLAAGANVNVAARTCRLTSLHYAALQNSFDDAVEMTKLLLSSPDLKINEQTLNGKTATDIAEEKVSQDF